MFFFLNEFSEDDDNGTVHIPPIPDFPMNIDWHKDNIFESEEINFPNIPDVDLPIDMCPITKEKCDWDYKEKEGDKAKPTELAIEDIGKNKLERRRMQCKARAKKSRDRKKVYIEKWEARIKELESENSKLLKLLQVYRKQTWNSVNKESSNLIGDIEKHRQRMAEIFTDPETCEYKENATMKCSDHFKETAPKVMEKHRKIMNLSFEMIIDHIYPFVSCYYWKHLDKGYNASFELIKKYNRQTKYQKPDFIATHKLTELDKLIASFNPDKRQFRFIKDVLLQKEMQVKAKFDQAIDLLLKSKEIISEASSEMFVFRNFLIKSGILSDKQIISSMLAFKSQSGEYRKFTDIWGIEIKPKILKFNLGKDPLFGKIAKKHLRKEERNLEIEYDSFYIPESST